MVLTKYTGIQTLTGSEAEIFNVNKGPSTIHFGSSVYLDELVSGDTVRVRVYDKKDGVGFWKFDGEVNDYVGSNNGTITYHTNLKALYKFEQNLNDSTTGAHALTLGAGTTAYTSGQEGSAISFDGSTYYTANSAVIVSGTSDRSVSFWLKTPSTFVTNSSIFSWGATSNNNGFGASWNSTASTSALLFYGFNNDITSNTIFQPNTWYHLVLTLSSSGTVRTIYINGVQDKQSTTTALNTTSSSLFIANFYGGGQIIQSGSIIDEFRIYSIAITQAQVSALYMVGKYGQSHTFDGGESISVGNPSSLSFEYNQTFSFAFWGKYSGSGTMGFFAKTAAGLGGAGYWIYTSGGSLNVQLVHVNNVNDILVSVSNALNDGSWHHFVITYSGNGLASGLSIYEDGISKTVSVGRDNLANNTIVTTANLVFGGLSASDSPLTGQLDDLRIYNRVLSASEVLDLYNNPQNLNSIVYDKQYSGPLTSKTLYIPIIQTNNYAVTLQQTAGNYYKTLDWSRIEIT